MLEAFADPEHEGNSSKFHTGKSCVEKGCDEPAGTNWSPLWCFGHNVERIKRISGQLDGIIAQRECRKIADAMTKHLREHCDRLTKQKDEAALVAWRFITDADKVPHKRVLLTVGAAYRECIGEWRNAHKRKSFEKVYECPAGWYERDASIPIKETMMSNWVADIPAAPSVPR